MSKRARRFWCWRSGALLLASACFLGEVAVASPWPSAALQAEKSLAQGTIEERRLAIARAALLRRAHAAPLVERALQDNDLEVRLMAARTARSLAFHHLSNRVVSWVKSQEVEERLEAIRLLALSPGLEGIGAIEQAAGDSSKRVRVEVARALGRVPHQYATRASTKLLQLLDDVETSVRIEAAASLGKVGDTSFAVALSSHLQDSEASVRVQVALALGAVGSSDVVPALVVALSDPQEDVVAAVAASLGRLSSDQAISGLTAIAERAAHRIDTRRALEALAVLATPESHQVLLEYLGSPGKRSVLKESFPVVGQEQVRLTTACLTSLAGDALLDCAKLHLSLGGPKGLVFQAHQDGRLSDAQVLELFRDGMQAEAVVLALEMLSAPSDSRYRVALDYLSGARFLSEQALEPLRTALVERARDPASIQQTLTALGRIRTSPPGAWLEPYLKSTHEGIRKAAARVSVLHGATEGALVELLLEDSELGRGALSGLSGGSSVSQAETLIDVVHTGAQGHRRALLSVFWAFPTGLAPAAVAQLRSLFVSARGAERDVLLIPLLRNLAVADAVELVSDSELQLAELRLAAQLAWHEERLLPIARLLVADPDAHVRGLALYALGAHGIAADARSLMVVAEDANEKYFVRAAALAGLIILSKRGVSVGRVDQLLEAEFCESKSVLLRTQALRLATAVGKKCSGPSLEELLLNDVDPRLRRLAAGLLSESDPNSGALKRCRIYESRREVERACWPARWGREESVQLPGAPPFRLTQLRSSRGRVARQSPAAVRVADETVDFALPRFSDREGHLLMPLRERGLVDAAWFF